MTEDTQKVTYRLIGAIAILVLVVLFWWLFLDHDVKRYQETKQSIPVPLKVERFEITPAQAPEPVVQTAVVEPQKIVEVTAASDAKKDLAKPEPETAPVAQVQAKVADKTPVKQQVKVDKAGVIEAWVVQVASFSKEQNARELEADLLKANYPAYFKQFNLDKGTFYRVYIGPKMSLQETKEIAQAVEKKFKLKGQIRQYKAGFEAH